MEDSQREKIREDFPDAPHLQTIAGFLRLAGDIPAFTGNRLPNTENVMKRWNS